jgi:hypothetical protein
MVGSGLGMAIMPALSLTGALPGFEITDPGPDRPSHVRSETAGQRRVTHCTVSDSRKSE